MGELDNVLGWKRSLSDSVPRHLTLMFYCALGVQKRRPLPSERRTCPTFTHNTNPELHV